MVLVWQCLHGVAPHYLADLCVRVGSEESHLHLRSAALGVLMFGHLSASGVVQSNDRQQGIGLDVTCTSCLKADLCVPVASEESRPHLRSAASGVLMVPSVRTSIGQWNRAVQGPTTRHRT